MPHPDESLIHAWLDGELDAAESARVEALVARDLEWAAAAADARGLIAASARIVSALDHVNANVTPKSGSPRRKRSWWMARVAAALLVVTSSALLLRQGRLLQAPKEPAREQGPAASPAPALSQGAPVAAATVAAADRPRSNTPGAETKKGVAPQAAPPKAEVVAVAAESTAGSGSHTRPSSVLNMEPSRVAQRAAPAAPAGAPRDQLAAARKDQLAAGAGPQLTKSTQEAVHRAATTTCFEIRQPADSVHRLVRLDSVQLADSTRSGRLTLQDDTLRSAVRRLLAVKVACPDR